MKHWRLVCAAALLLGTGCSSQGRLLRVFPVAMPKVPHYPGPNQVEVEKCGATRVFGIRFGTAPSFTRAVEEAVAEAGSDFNGLADVTAEFKRHEYGFMGWDCVTVVGRPVFVGVRALPDELKAADAVPEGTKAADWEF